MDKTYYHRPCLANAGRTVYMLFGVSIVLCWLPVISGRLLHGFYAGVSFDLPFALSVTLFFGGMLLITLSRELRKSCFVVTEDVLIHKTPYRVTVIRFDDAVSFTCRFHFVRGRLAELRAGDKRIGMGITIAGLRSLVEAVEEQLSSHDRGNVVDRRRTAVFKRRARITDALFERSARGAVPFAVNALLFVTAGGVIAGRIWPLGVVAQIVWTLTSMLFVGVWLIAFFLIFIGQRLRAAPRRGFVVAVRNIDPAWLAGAITLVSYMTYGIWFRNWVMH